MCVYVAVIKAVYKGLSLATEVAPINTATDWYQICTAVISLGA